MSAEITTQVSLSVRNGTYVPPTWTEIGSVTQTTIDAAGGVINCTTAFADVPLGSVGTIGYCQMKNLDSTNNVDIGLDVTGVFTACQTLKPGESACFRWKAGVVPAVKAQAGTPKLQYWLLSD